MIVRVDVKMAYSLRKIGNGWIVGRDISYCDPVFELQDTFAPTLGEAFEIIRKHAKELKPGQQNKMDQYSEARQ